MKELFKPVVFVCAGSGSCAEDKPAQRMANELVQRGIAEMGDIASMILDQDNLELHRRRRMIFINDCAASCIKMLIQQHKLEHAVYVDLNEHVYSLKDFDVEKCIEDSLPGFFNSSYF
ncbi:MAG TPA: putative zinc-binding protein [Chryseolinea sp.]|jgi:uncharacterized metal-binding protein|nr:putative zinc-binding protein [Chryseolinea sp.]HPM31316.1 putative zinc-binding protein [Chryseolinea sp.]